jgi:hypothetical protein
MPLVAPVTRQTLPSMPFDTPSASCPRPPGVINFAGGLRHVAEPH